MEGIWLQNILITLGVFASVVLLAWVWHQSRRARMHDQAEVRRHLLDKFASGRELTEFLATPQGKSLMKELEAARSPFPWPGPKQRIIHSIRMGIVLVVLGSASFALMYLEQGFVYPGTFLMALGVGLLIASAVSYHLHKKWGLFE
jgi:hypothetical protein